MGLEEGLGFTGTLRLGDLEQALRRRNESQHPLLTRTDTNVTVRLRLIGLGPPVLDRFATVSDRFWGPGAGFWNLEGQMEGTAKKREKTGKKWARYGLKKVGPMTE